jgi:hypothetical protein
MRAGLIISGAQFTPGHLFVALRFSEPECDSLQFRDSLESNKVCGRKKNCMTGLKPELFISETTCSAKRGWPKSQRLPFSCSAIRNLTGELHAGVSENGNEKINDITI